MFWGAILGSNTGSSTFWVEDFNDSTTPFGVWEGDISSGQLVDGRLVLTTSETWASFAGLSNFEGMRLPVRELSVEGTVVPPAQGAAGPLLQGEVEGFAATIERDGTLGLWHGEILLASIETEPLRAGDAEPITLDLAISDSGTMVYLEASRKAMLSPDVWVSEPGAVVSVEVPAAALAGEPVELVNVGLVVLPEGEQAQASFDHVVLYEQRSPNAG